MAVSYVKFQRGSQAAYDKLAKESRLDDNTLYFIYPEADSPVGKLYLGARLISGGDVVLSAASLDSLADVIAEEVKVHDFLVAEEVTDAEGNKTVAWLNKSLDYVANLIKNAMGEIAAPAQIFQAERTPDHANDEAAIAEQVGDKTLTAGDMAIVKTPITDGKYQYTAYVHNGEMWVAMDGNYDAKNVLFANDFTLAGSYTAVGNITKSSTTATGTLSAKGKSLDQLIQNIFTKELNPTKDLPTIALSGDSDQSGEVGTTFTLPTVTVKVSDVGSYTYGPATGITFPIGDLTIAECTSTSTKSDITGASNKKSNTAAAVTNSTVSLTASDAKGTVYTDSVISYTFDAVGSYTQGAMPKTNLGNDYESARIAAGDAHCDARTIKRTGWRNYWYGFVSTTTAAGLTRITDSTATNYNKVTDGTKTLTAGGAAISNTTLPTIAAATGDRMPVVVFPTSANKKVVSASMPSSLNAPVTFTKIGTVNLAGANGASAVSYDIWGYVADDMPVGADFSIVIGNQ